MEEIGGEPVAAAAQQEDEEQQPASKAKKKKKGKAAAADTEDIDALLAQLDGPPEQQQTATSSELAAAAESPAKAEAEPAGKGKKKKKKGKASAKDEEDLDAVLAELGMAPAATPEAQPTTDAQPQVSHAAPADEAAAAPAADGAAEEDNDAAAAEDGKVCILCLFAPWLVALQMHHVHCYIQIYNMSMFHKPALAVNLHFICHKVTTSLQFLLQSLAASRLQTWDPACMRQHSQTQVYSPPICSEHVKCHPTRSRLVMSQASCSSVAHLAQEMTAAEKKKAKKKAREKAKKAGGDADDAAAPAAAKKGGKKVSHCC